MDPQPPDHLTSSDDETPEALLEAFRTHPEWTERQRDEQLDRLIERVPADRLLAAARERMSDLSGTEGEVILRIIEAHATPALLRELGTALVSQPHLSPERTWEVVTLLDGAELLDEFPELVARSEELDELLDEEGSLEQLAEQLEGDPEGTWLALQGLGAVEPEIRPQIIEGLAQGPIGPGLAEFLRLLCFAHDPPTRAAALEALSQPSETHEHLVAVWESIAADHPDAEVVARAKDWLTGRSKVDLPAVGQATTAIQTESSVARSLVTALDGRGRGTIVLASYRKGSLAAGAFVCDVSQGVCDVIGQADLDSPQEAGLFEELVEQTDLEIVENVPELALRLLGGSVLLCGRSTPPTLRYWLEATMPPGFRALPFPAPFPGWDPSVLPFDEMFDRAQAVLDACPSWLDDSPLTYELAEEIALREGAEALPNPKRDAGAYRFLFEHRLFGQLELYRRMLYWMASFWQAGGREYLGQSALALAGQLSDAQHSVPSHPFTVALSTRSLATAQENLRQGIDPRRMSRSMEA
ncbi:hypothetical protein V5E97_21890 [Singulisphaera sp. Ch08]|uniref:HEAT repeat domain-containing protein n=1 Tax=Singulisphaera sp. Ch08 TaxID=3120278 RepID=A0AAU7C721_9BACT